MKINIGPEVDPKEKGAEYKEVEVPGKYGMEVPVLVTWKDPANPKVVKKAIRNYLKQYVGPEVDASDRWKAVRRRRRDASLILLMTKSTWFVTNQQAKQIIIEADPESSLRVYQSE